MQYGIMGTERIKIMKINEFIIEEDNKGRHYVSQIKDFYTLNGKKTPITTRIALIYKSNNENWVEHIQYIADSLNNLYNE